MYQSDQPNCYHEWSPGAPVAACPGLNFLRALTELHFAKWESSITLTRRDNGAFPSTFPTPRLKAQARNLSQGCIDWDACSEYEYILVRTCATFPLPKITVAVRELGMDD